MDFLAQSQQLCDLLGLTSPPVSVTFRADAPPDVRRIEAAAPSGCSYWKLAAEGQVFYTEASDHYGCPIGSYTHGVSLPAAQSKELEGMIETMVGLNYLKPEEVPAIPRREEPFGVVIYAPLANTPLPPDVILVRGNAKQMMLLNEAINASAAEGETPGGVGGIMGRPTCAVIPAVLKTQQAALSLGGIGNRVYNELSDGELFTAIAGAELATIVEKLSAITRANSQLEEFHSAKTA